MSEEPLDLADVEVHADDPVHPGDRQQVGHQFRGDRDPGTILPILPRVAVVGDHRVDPGRRRPLERVHHDQEFHQVLVDGRRRGLDHESVRAADVVPDLEADLSVAKTVQRRLREGNAEVPRDRGRQVRIGRAPDDLQFARKAMGRALALAVAGGFGHLDRADGAVRTPSGERPRRGITDRSPELRAGAEGFEPS